MRASARASKATNKIGSLPDAVSSTSETRRTVARSNVIKNIGANVKKIKSILVANRGEIAIRIMRGASELGIRTVAVYANEDRFSLHRFKADESYLVGRGKKPIEAYLAIDELIKVAKKANVDAIHPGYGFLSENPTFADECLRNELIFIGPSPAVMRTLGNKVEARKAAISAGVPVIPATGALPHDLDAIRRLANEIGYPLMLKASWGGGGRGMRVIQSDAEIFEQIAAGRREAEAAFGNSEVYLEKLLLSARHVEVQVLGDLHGNLIHLYERDCSVQRRNQKVVERAPAPYLIESERNAVCASALRLCRSVSYTHAGTVEFLYDVRDRQFYFIEVNPRIQVEHTVTEEITGIDIVKAQIRISEGEMLGGRDLGLPNQSQVRMQGHAVQCRVTTEDPENNFVPDYGRLTAYRSATGFGVRLDSGTAYSGAIITPFFDSLLVKVTTRGHDSTEAISRMDRALREFRIRGVSTNLQFLENVIRHPKFISGECTTRFIDDTPELFELPPKRDRATKFLNFIGDISINGNPEMKGRMAPSSSFKAPLKPDIELNSTVPFGTLGTLKQLGPFGFSEWLRQKKQVMLTDTTMRDAHQSLFATRMRSIDMVEIAPYYAQMLPNLLSIECWGGATFDVAMRFLKEDPWERLIEIRKHIPNIPLQMLLRSSNAVGYTNYADNVVRYFITQAASNGIDIFRVFDSLNWVENMRVAMDSVIDSGSLCEGTICYTGDVFDQARPKYNLSYYVKMAKELERAGAHVIGIKDMAGVCRPRAIRALVCALHDEVGLPLHFHTHDTSGIASATVLAAIEAGVDAIDGALDAMSGLTSQPNLTSIAKAIEGTELQPDIDLNAMKALSNYWEGVRRYYAPFEADIRSSTSDVYCHEMPGGQYTNLREQARSMGLESRWQDVANAYSEVNALFGDIIKVTPTSKVVGDMALFMVANELTSAIVLDPSIEVSFPESVVSLFKGDLGRPPEGFPEKLSQKVLQGKAPLTERPGAFLAQVDLDEIRKQAEEQIGRSISATDLASYLMYPTIFSEFAAHDSKYGNVSRLPTTSFFYGMAVGEEIAVDIDAGKTLVIRLQGITDAVDNDGMFKKLFFELNGQPRIVRIEHKVGEQDARLPSQRKRVEDGNPEHVGAPMPGSVGAVSVVAGQVVKKGDPLFTIEAMKMETVVRAEFEATVKEVFAKYGLLVSPKDLLITLKR